MMKVSTLILASVLAWNSSAKAVSIDMQQSATSEIEAYADGEPLYVWLSPQGSDSGEGTEASPFASLKQAFAHVRALRQEAGSLGEVHIVMKGGIYRMSETLNLTPEDSGTPDAPVIVEAAEGETPILSGGMPVDGWQVAGDVKGLPEIARGHVWEAATPVVDGQTLNFRQFWVNDNKMIRATTFDKLKMSQIIKVDKAAGELVIPTPKVDLSDPEGMELTIVQDWTQNMMRVNTVKTDGFRTTLTFKQPESEIQFKRPWPILKAEEGSHCNHRCYLSNSIALLNSPQEWFNDVKNGKLYYWPRYGEQPDGIDAIVPRLETLVSIKGSSLEQLASYIQFNGITFEHTTWMRPSEQGHIALQAGQWMYDGYSIQTEYANNVAWLGRPAAGISVENARGIAFERCVFRHMGSTGIDIMNGSKQTTIRGCVFSDVGGNGILGGYFGDENHEAHTPWNPEDKRVVCDSLLINNNYIVAPSSEDWGTHGICVGYASNVTISRNEVCETPYSSISLGWGWIKHDNCMHDNHITGNYIHHFVTQMRDAAAIYTLSAQPKSSIKYNFIEDLCYPQFNPIMWAGMRDSRADIYMDEGTSYFEMDQNYSELGNFSFNQTGTNNVGTNGPSVTRALIKRKSGLETAYTDIKDLHRQMVYAPLDSIAEPDDDEIVEYIAQGEGFKLGNAIAVDLNNDNLKDIVYGGGEDFQVRVSGVRINAGGYAFVGSQPLQPMYYSNFAAGDLNGDGWMDLIQCGFDFWDYYSAVWTNDGTGKLEEKKLKSKMAAPALGIADLDNNGLSDYFFIGNGTDNSFFMQHPNRTFSSAKSLLSLPGGFSDPHAMYADFNNDGSIDIALLSVKTDGVYTRIWYNDGNGNFTEKTVGFKEKGTRGTMACADVNADGWLDVIVGGCVAGETVDYSAAQGGKTSTLYLNNGDGTFTKHQEFSEYMGDNVTQSVRFGDWDNDGHSDLILAGWNKTEGNVSRTDVFLNDGNGNFTKIDANLPGASEVAIELADFSNTGKNDVLISGNCNGGYQGYTVDRRIAVLYKNPTTKLNTAPTAPTELEAVVNGQDVTLKWGEGADDETPVKTLSYNYYLRNVDTGLFLTFPDADIATGLRRVSRIGNVSLNKQWTLHNLLPGTYAWSVQTVDAGYAGSEFAQEQTFVIADPTSITDFKADGDGVNVSVDGNTLTLSADQPQTVNVYTISGILLRTISIDAEETTITLPSGCYMVDRQKVIVR